MVAALHIPPARRLTGARMKRQRFSIALEKKAGWSLNGHYSAF